MIDVLRKEVLKTQLKDYFLSTWKKGVDSKNYQHTEQSKRVINYLVNDLIKYGESKKIKLDKVLRLENSLNLTLNGWINNLTERPWEIHVLFQNQVKGFQIDKFKEILQNTKQKIAELFKNTFEEILKDPLKQAFYLQLEERKNQYIDVCFDEKQLKTYKYDVIYMLKKDKHRALLFNLKGAKSFENFLHLFQILLMEENKNGETN